jgi:quercetin dioxygenase-like cupin family protein
VSAALGAVSVLSASDGPELPIVSGEGRAHAVVWPGIGARLRSLHVVSLAPGSRTLRLQHASDAVYYVISGSGEVLDGHATITRSLGEGAMIHVDAGTPYTLLAAATGLEVVGGPAPADPSLYSFSHETAER